jgi:hypothetical protein
MEEIIQQRLREFNRLQADYDELYDKFQLSHRLHDEKEAIYQKQIKELTDIIVKLKQKNSKLKAIVSTDKEMKESFQQDVMKLQDLFRVMEEKEKEFLSQIEALRDENNSLSKDNADKQETMLRVQQDLSALHGKIETEMVAKSDYQLLQSQYNSLQFQFQQMHADVTSGQKFVTREQYDQLDHSYQNVLNNVKSKFVEVELYQRLQENYEGLFHEKKLLEDSIQLVQENQELVTKEKLDLSGRLLSLRERIEKNEDQLTSRAEEIRQLHEELSRAREETSLLLQEKSELLGAQELLEKQKVSYLMQINSLKAALKKEGEARGQLIEEKQSAEKELYAMKLEYSTKLIESNTKITSIYENTEFQFKSKISELQTLNKVLNEKVANLQALLDNTQEKAAHLAAQSQQQEREAVELKSKLAVQAAYYENLSKENADLQQQLLELREEKFQLTQKVLELSQIIDEFRVTIVSELSPSIGRFFNQGPTSAQSQQQQQQQQQAGQRSRLGSSPRSSPPWAPPQSPSQSRGKSPGLTLTGLSGRYPATTDSFSPTKSAVSPSKPLGYSAPPPVSVRRSSSDSIASEASSLSQDPAAHLPQHQPAAPQFATSSTAATAGLSFSLAPSAGAGGGGVLGANGLVSSALPSNRSSRPASPIASLSGSLRKEPQHRPSQSERDGQHGAEESFGSFSPLPRINTPTARSLRSVTNNNNSTSQFEQQELVN